MTDSLTRAKEKGILNLLLNPFEVIAGFQALLIGIAGIVIASLIASRAHYDIYLFIIGITLILLAIIWAIMLMYRAFSISCNAKGAKAVGYFIAITIIGEIMTKLLYGFYDMKLHK